MNWLQDMDTLLVQMMVELRHPHQRGQLQDICKADNVPFYEFHLFSETRFIQYAHRTYTNIIRMYETIYKYYQAIAVADESGSEDSKHMLEKLFNVEHVVRLLFMNAITSVMKISSKAFQRDDVLPWHGKYVVAKLIVIFVKIESSFDIGEIPDLRNTLAGTAFENFKTAVEDVKSGTFRNIPLMLRGQQGRSTRCSVEQSSIDNTLYHTLRGLGLYVNKLRTRMTGRFLPWPQWLIDLQMAFDFKQDISVNTRVEEGFKPLLDEDTNHAIALNSTDKQKLLDQFRSLCHHTSDFDRGNNSSEELLYNICTDDSIIRSCSYVLKFAMPFLTRSFNECIVESQFSVVNDTDDPARTMMHSTVVNCCYIRQNGPDPLKCQSVVRSGMDLHFGSRPWHFVTNDNRFYTSTVIENSKKKAETRFSVCDL